MQREFKISLSQEFYSDIVYLSQYDSDYPVIFTVTDKYSKASGINGYTAKFTGTRGDGTGLGFTYTATAIGHTVSFMIDTMLTGVAGTHAGEIIFYDQNGLYFGTANVQIIVEPAARPDGTIDADEEELRDLAQQCQDIVDTAAAEVKGEAESWAVGERDGEPVPSTDPTYHNNAKYYAEQAQDIADSIGIDATLSVAGKSADAKKTGDEISSLKEELNYTDEVIRGIAYNPYTWEAGTYLSIAVGATIRKENRAQYINIRKRFVDITTVDFSSTITMNSGYLIKLFEVDANDVILSATNYTTTVNLQPGKRYAALLKATGDADISNVDVSDMLTTSIAVSQIEQNRQDIQQIKSVTDGLVGKDLIESVMVTSVNLYDNSTSVIGYYIQTNGNTVSGANYAYTGMIELDAGSYVTKSYYNTYGANGRKVFLYNDEGTFLSSFNATEIANTDLMTFTLDSNSHVRLNTNKADAESNYMVVSGSDASDYPTQFVPYSVTNEVEPGISLNDTMKEEVSEIIGETSSINPLYGKAISFIGDSICAGAGYAGGYGGIIAQENEMIYQNVGVSGATITAETYASGNPRAWICRRIDQMSETAEYAILEGGVNDASLEVTLGEISNGYYTPVLDDTTFYGAFESCLKQMTIRFSGKKIGYIIPHQMANGMRPGADYYNAVIACCKKWGVPVLDLSTEIPPFNFFPTSGDSPLHTMRETYTASGDGWHPTEAGYRKYYVDKITAWLKAL